MIRRTAQLQSFPEQSLLEQAKAVVDQIPRDIMPRTAAFLLLKDSRSSYAIEGESPPHSRIERWGRIIGEAGTSPITVAELQRLQELVIGGSRFVPRGLRREGGFVGEHDRETGTPIPEHISARPEDLPNLMSGLTSYIEEAAMDLPALVGAAGAAFGFVYMHPFSAGNGRIHRYLVHHVLARKGFGEPGIVFPVSAAFLQAYDAFRREVSAVVDMPDHTIHNLFRFLKSNNGTLPKRRRTGEFADLTERQLGEIHRVYARYMTEVGQPDVHQYGV